MTFNIHAMILVLIMAGLTCAIRVVPYLIFGTRDTIPSFILYLGEVLPYAAMGMLVIYCLKDATPLTGTHAIPEIISVAVVAGSYVWRRNTIASILLGTALYMFLVQVVF